jgi:hypothetical protein
MDLRTKAVAETAFLHLTDAEDNKLYEQKAVEEDGQQVLVDDLEKPVGITMYGPGSKPYAKAKAKQHNAMMDRLKKKGRSDQSPDDIARENAELLAACTKSFHHIERDKLEGEALYMAVFTDQRSGFITEQAGRHIGEWGNFTKGSAKA